jgi:hypothetical protein
VRVAALYDVHGNRPSGPEAAGFAEHAAQPPPASTAAELYG